MLNKSTTLDLTFQALADPTRRLMLAQLARGRTSVSELARPLAMSLPFPAPRELVFRAWSSADHLRHWFCPAGFTVPEAQVEFRVGGAFNICMCSPEGQRHWTKGRYAEIVPHTRLVIDMNAVA